MTGNDETRTFSLGDDQFTMVPTHNGLVCLLVTRADSLVYEIATSPEDETGRELDNWLRRTYPENPLQGFKGFFSERWDHETGMIEERKFLTPGAVVASGGIDLASIIEWQEGCGDRILVVRNVDGEVLYDRKEQVRADLTEETRPW